MKNLIVFLAFSTFALSACGQEAANLAPSRIDPLDFSDRAKAEWAQRDALLDQLASGTKDWDNLTDTEQALLDKYEEIYENIWDVIGGGSSWYNAGGPYQVSASSALKAQGSNSYGAQNAHDLSYETAWVEGVAGYGIGESLTYSFYTNSPRITEITIVNGYVKSRSAYRNNARVKKLKVYLNDDPYAMLNLEDTVANQVFKFDPIGFNRSTSDEGGYEKPDWTLKFEILEIYEGAKYEDTAISEIYFNGIDVLCFARGTPVQLADHSTKAIEELKIGDSIAYLDHETNQIKSAKIEELNRAIHQGLVRYTFASGLEVTATQDHPFKLENKGWASLQPESSKRYRGFDQVARIQIGDVFLTSNGTDRLVSMGIIDEKQVTYTISRLSSGDNFMANGFIVGVEELKSEYQTVNHFFSQKRK